VSQQDLVELNWELCIAYLDDALRELHECIARLEQAKEKVDDLEEAL